MANLNKIEPCSVDPTSGLTYCVAHSPIPVRPPTYVGITSTTQSALFVMCVLIATCIVTLVVVAFGLLNN